MPTIGGRNNNGWMYLSAGAENSIIWNNGSPMQFCTENVFSGDLNEKVRITSSGDVGIGTSAPTSRLDVAGTMEADGLKLNGNGAAAGRVLTSDAAGVATWQTPPSAIWSTNGPFVYYNNGPLGLGQTVPRLSIDVTTPGVRGLPTIGGRNNNGWRYLSAGAENSIIWNSGSPMQFCTENVFSGDLNEKVRITSSGDVGIGTSTPAAKLDVNGVTRTHALTLTGGADIAEPFDIHGDQLPEAGMVLCIDPERPGKLRLATDAYDRTVAGVISGAGGIKPAMTLQQEGSVADGEFPVALTGRVYVRVDADAGGPVKPGDLLTTSPTPGHAMKVVDHIRASGATLGKAMTPLESGQGLVLVLVSLQ